MYAWSDGPALDTLRARATNACKRRCGTLLISLAFSWYQLRNPPDHSGRYSGAAGGVGAVPPLRHLAPGARVRREPSPSLGQASRRDCDDAKLYLTRTALRRDSLPRKRPALPQSRHSEKVARQIDPTCLGGQAARLTPVVPHTRKLAVFARANRVESYSCLPPGTLLP